MSALSPYRHLRGYLCPLVFGHWPRRAHQSFFVVSSPAALPPKGTLQHIFVQSWLSVPYTYSLQGQGQALADHSVGRLMFSAIADCSFPLRIIRLGIGCSMQAAVEAPRFSSASDRQVSLH